MQPRSVVTQYRIAGFTHAADVILLLQTSAGVFRVGWPQMSQGTSDKNLRGR